MSNPDENSTPTTTSIADSSDDQAQLAGATNNNAAQSSDPAQSKCTLIRRFIITEGSSVTAILAVVSCLILFLTFYYLSILERHRLEGFQPSSQFSEHLYLISAIVGAAGALLQAGILVLAPILSLSLHQSYDVLFDLVIRSMNSGQPEEQKIGKACFDTLRRYKRSYKILNPFFHGFWIFTCVFLGITAIRLLLIPWTAGDIVHESMGFFIASLLLCWGFAILSLLFFLLIRPGVTKLDYYDQYFIVKWKEHLIKNNE